MQEVQGFLQIAATQDQDGTPIIIGIDSQFQPWHYHFERKGWVPMPKAILKEEV